MAKPRLPAAGLTTVLVLSLVLCANSQQQPPLQGQGVDPVSANLVEGQVPVFVTVELVKLLDLDEQEYTFRALLNFDLSWDDPRAPQVWDVIESSANYSLQQINKSVTACSNLIDGDGNTANLSAMASPDCQQAQQEAPPCTKYCDTYGQSTDNPYMCCDNVWVPDMELRNLVDISQDRVVSDFIWKLPNEWSPQGVHRNTLVLGRFYTALDFSQYPFDRQKLQVFVDANSLTYYEFPPFRIEASGVFRRLDVIFTPGLDRNGTITAKSKDQLAGWNITNVTFSCADLKDEAGDLLPNTRPISQQTQFFAPGDEFGDHYDGGVANPATFLNRTCVFVIEVERLSSTAVAQSIVPVAFISALAFSVFATEPDNLDIRLSTEVTLFLALTAVQFIFSAVLPVASYLSAFDIFILLSYSLIVVIIVENCVVAYICSRREHFQRKAKTSQRAAYANGNSLSFAPPPGFPSEGERLKSESEECGQVVGCKSQENGDPPEQEVSEEEGSPPQVDVAQQGKSRSGLLSSSVRAMQSPFVRASTRWADDPAEAYALACTIDLCFAAAVMIIYVVLSIVNFTVGLAPKWN